MIDDQGLPMHLWAEASSTIVYVHNRSPHKILGNKTPKEVFTGKKPEVSHLRIFGCLVFIHVPKEKRTKLEPSGKKGTFIGYNETSKTYRIYIPGKRQIENSRDVKFDEDETFRRSRKSHIDEDQIEKRPHKFSNYVELMSNIIDSEPSTFEEVAEKPKWKDAIMEEYQFIMKNDVWKVVLRPERKSVVTSK
jgi:hypothetical protein